MRRARSATNGPRQPSPRGPPVLPLVAAGTALALGLLVYLADRDAAHSLLIPRVAALAGAQVFGALGGWLPSWAHAFAFSLFTAAVLPAGPAPRYGACIAWGAINVAFELGQHPQVSGHLAEALRSGFGPSALTQPLAQYFLRGTFDGGDIAAAVLGALMAAGVLRLAHRGPGGEHAKT